MREVERAGEKRRALVLTLIGLLVVEAFAIGYLKRGTDKGLLVASMVAQATTLVTFLPFSALRRHSVRVSTLAHTLFGIVMLSIPLVGASAVLLALQACMALFTLASRSALGGCMYSAADDDQVLLDPGINWDWAFALAGGLSVVRLATMAGGRGR